MRSKHHRQYGQQVGRAEEARTQMVSGLLDQFDQLEILRALIRAAQHKENTGQSHTQLTDEPEVRPDQTEQEATANSAETAPAKDPKAIETHLSSTRLESPRPSAFGYADATQQVGGRVSNQIAVLGTGDVDFRFLEIRFSGPAGARDAFERLVADIVSIVHPDVREIQANPGDWGIDAFVGDLGEDGEVHIWQSKYFINGFGSSQQSEVRDSYKSAQKAAGEQGYRIASWTLCIPCELDGPMLKWWDGWKKRTAKADSLTIELESGGRLRRKLQAPAGENVRKFYSPPFSPRPNR